MWTTSMNWPVMITSPRITSVWLWGDCGRPNNLERQIWFRKIPNRGVGVLWNGIFPDDWDIQERLTKKDYEVEMTSQGVCSLIHPVLY